MTEESLEQTLEAAVAQLPPEPSPTPEPVTEPVVQAAEPTPDTSAPPPEPTPEPQQPTRFDGVFDYLKQNYGVDLSAKYKTPEQFLNGAVHAMSKVGERDSYAQLGRQLQENPEAVYQALQERYGSKPEAVSATQAAATGKPEFDPSWIHSLEIDERGNPTGVKPGEDPSILSKWRAAKAYATKRQNDLLFNEDAVFGPREQKLREQITTELEQKFNERLQQALEGQQVVSQQTNEAYSFLSQHPEFFADSKDITKGLSPAGLAFNNYMQEALQFGADPGNTPLLVNYAMSKLAATKPSTPPKPQPLSTAATAHRPNANLPPQGQRAIEDGEDLLTAIRRNLKTEGILGAT